MASMLDKMDSEVAKKALEQFPEFANTTKEMLIEYKESLDKDLGLIMKVLRQFMILIMR